MACRLPYGSKRDYPKIDLYGPLGSYLGTTTWARTLKIAREKAAETFGTTPENITAKRVS